ncbi:DUF2855 family protein [Aspergillus undulatus]|uniref:DUF2855 family protein n=1 Tax=Aspergillus undulatus TaxID=1810928 RepID=UPI003CCE21F4
MDVHVISKANNTKHATFQLPNPTTPLKPSSIRIRSSLLSLSSNNLSYALHGTRLAWWDTYPVPPSAPAPYNDPTEWGIVPAWGLATVLESTVPEITPGTALYGFWPTSSRAVDLEIAPAEVEGHYKEVSAHRQTLMPIYNRLSIFDTQGKDLSELGWVVGGLRPIFMAGYVLSEYAFTPDPANHPPIHPLSGAIGEGSGWGAEDADLSKSVFVSLSASGKTARTVAFNFSQRPRSAGPLGLLQVTSLPGALDEAAAKSKPGFPVWNVAYSELETGAEWIAALKPERIVIADFGARDGALEKIHRIIEAMEELKGVRVVVLAVGNQQKVYTSEDIQAAQASFASLNKQQFNTSPVVESAIRLTGMAKYQQELQHRFNLLLESRDSVAPDLRLVWGQGITGKDGLEGGWDALSASQVKPDEALLYHV